MTRRVVQQVEIDALPADVWRHLTDRAGLSRWLMPTDDFEARPGHAFTFHTVPVGDVGGWDGVVRCRVLEVIDERRLSWTWTSNALRVETVVVITLDDLGGRTLVTVDHSGWEGLPAEQAWLADEHGRGWGHLLARQLKPQVEGR